ncbi:MAG: molybdopterin-dependent oxidoreductase [Deltaproteobacteria bacterium]|nr:molybdopterin-dependent oxidoreductase [Deltaproteobacteria bacterium]
MQAIQFVLNGVPRKVITDPQRKLVEVIRRDLKLTGTKEGCKEGHCGTCTVLLDGQAVLACKIPVIKVRGREVTTIEGLGSADRPHPLQLAFAKAGAIQCGFCTPGLILRSKALLDKNPHPGREEIKAALQPHLCRCTGYQKVFEAVELAASVLRGETGPISLQTEGGLIGRPVPRIDALPKAAGTALYADDIAVDGCCYLKVLRSPYPHAQILEIDKTTAEQVAGVLAVFTAEDVDGTNILKMAGDDQPLLCQDKVRFIGDPVAAVAAVTEQAALQALNRIKVTYKPLEPVLTPWEALGAGAPRVHDDRDNLFFQQPIIFGGAGEDPGETEITVEARYTTQTVDHGYLEPDSGVAFIHENGQLVIISGSQNIHAHRKTIGGAIGLPLEQIRIIQPPMGGAFGGHLDVSVGGLLGLAAWNLQRPVKLVFTREEVFQATTKRHPFFMDMKINAAPDGAFTGLEVELLADGGAYKSFSNSVTTRGVVHASGPYRFRRARLLGRAVYTNTAVRGAMRGFGVPQTIFALESAVDELALQMGIDPLELRLKNAFVPGDTTVCGQILTDAFGYRECLETLRPHYRRALEEAKSRETAAVKRGVGLAGIWFGPGRSAPDQSEAWAELLPDDRLQIWIGAADMGQGAETLFWQVAAETMGYPLERVLVCTTDTRFTPDGNFSAGSRQTYVSGRAVQMAVEELKKNMAANRAAGYDDLKAKGLPTLYKAINRPETTKLDPADGRGVPWETYSFGIQMAEVAVALETGKIKVLKVTAVNDLGTVINRQIVEGQIEGAILMGLGYALTEEFLYNVTDNFAKFRMPRAKDAPEMVVITLDIPRKKGPFGASGTAEYADAPTAPAIMNAVAHACGARIRDLPATPEKIVAALRI